MDYWSLFPLEYMVCGVHISEIENEVRNIKRILKIIKPQDRLKKPPTGVKAEAEGRV